MTTKLSLRRPFWSYARVQKWRSSLTRDRRAFMNFKERGTYLDIGCGPLFGPDRLNLDYVWQPGIDICCDLRNGIPLSDSYVGGIFSQHCIEKLTITQSLAVFREMFRVLMPGRWLRIVAPSLEIFIEHYNAGTQIPTVVYDEKRAPFMTPAIAINCIMHEHGHQFIWDFETFKLGLMQAGFVDIQKRSFREGNDPKLSRLDSEFRAVESLYLEARRPS